MFLLDFCVVIIDVNIFLIILNNLLLLTIFCSKLFVLVHLNKMVLLNVKIDILLKQLTLF